MMNLELDVYAGDLKPIVNEVDPLLIVRPEIRVFGKLVHQNRSVGFFQIQILGSNCKIYSIDTRVITTSW